MNTATEHYVADVKDIPEGERLIVKVKGREIGIFNIKGEYYALRNICFHQSGPLCEGYIDGTFVARPENNWKREWAYEDEILRCPWHYMEFNIKTGQCLPFPNRRVRTYETKVKEEQLFLFL